MEQTKIKTTIETIIENDIPENLINNEERKVLIDNFITSEEEFLLEKKEVLKCINEKRINYEKGLFNRKYDKEMIEQIDTLISFVSYAAVPITNSIEQTPIQKTMELFPKIKNIILLCSSESEETAEELKNTMINYKILIKRVDINRFNDSYNKLRKAIYEGEIYEDKTIIDLTLGLKMTSLAFYKISTEFGIKTVNWQEIQAKNADNRFIRVPGTNHFYFVEEPKLENYKLYRNIDRAIVNFNFKTVSYLYDQINNNDMAMIYNELAKVFNFTALEEFSDFQNRIDNFFIEIKKAKLTWKRFTRFNKLFILLENIASNSINTEKEKEDALFGVLLEDENYYNKYDINMGIKNIKWSDNLNMDLLKEEERRILYYFLFEEYSKFKADGDIFLYKLSIENLFKHIEENEQIELPNERRELNVKERIIGVSNIFIGVIERLIEDFLNTNLDFDLDYLTLIEELKEIRKKIILTEDKLIMPGLDIEIDLLIEKKLTKNIFGKGVNKEIIRDLFKSKEGQIKYFGKLVKMDKTEYLRLDDEELTKIIRTPWNRFKGDINKLNRVFNEYFEINSISFTNRKVIILNDEKIKDNNKYKTAVLSINPYFFGVRK